MSRFFNARSVLSIFFSVFRKFWTYHCKFVAEKGIGRIVSKIFNSISNWVPCFEGVIRIGLSLHIKWIIFNRFYHYITVWLYFIIDILVAYIYSSTTKFIFVTLSLLITYCHWTLYIITPISFTIILIILRCYCNILFPFSVPTIIRVLYLEKH